MINIKENLHIFTTAEVLKCKDRGCVRVTRERERKRERERGKTETERGKTECEEEEVRVRQKGGESNTVREIQMKKVERK